MYKKCKVKFSNKIRSLWLVLMDILAVGLTEV